MNALFRLLEKIESPKKLTQEDVDRYIREGGCLCPFCKGNLIADSGPFDVGPSFARHAVRCLDCGARWIDRYAHIGVSVQNGIGGEDYFYAETDADRAAKALIEEIDKLLDATGTDEELAFEHLLRVLNRIAPEVVQQRYLQVASRLHLS